jgi:hypothetical protein
VGKPANNEFDYAPNHPLARRIEAGMRAPNWTLWGGSVVLSDR